MNLPTVLKNAKGEPVGLSMEKKSFYLADPASRAAVVEKSETDTKKSNSFMRIANMIEKDYSDKEIDRAVEEHNLIYQDAIPLTTSVPFKRGANKMVNVLKSSAMSLAEGVDNYVKGSSVAPME